LGERASNLFGVLLSLTFFSVLLAVMLVAVSILPDVPGLAPPTLPGETGSRPVRTPQPITLGELALAPAPALGPAGAAPTLGSTPAVPGTEGPGGETIGPPIPGSDAGGPGSDTGSRGPNKARDDERDEGRFDDKGKDGHGRDDDDGDEDDSDDDGPGKSRGKGGGRGLGHVKGKGKGHGNGHGKGHSKFDR
jgi:hypothetical protein